MTQGAIKSEPYMTRNNSMKLLITMILTVLSSIQTIDGQMQKTLDDIRSTYGLMGLSVVRVSKGEITGIYHSGLRDLERNLPVTDSTKFRIASISKLVTTTALMKLHDGGLFNLDDDISGYLGFKLRNPAHPEIPITFRMILSHTGSINEGSGYDRFLTATYNNVGNPPDFSQLLIPGGIYYTDDMWRKEAPGSYFTYCNANFGLAGTLIEKISGERFDRFVDENLFRPMGITGSFTVEGVRDINNLSVLYRNEDGRWAPQADNFMGVMSSPRDFSGYITGTNAAVFSPQGGLRISAAELAGIMMLHLNDGRYDGKKIISKKSIRLMRTPQWTWNGSNGDDNHGQFRCWGLSVHITTNAPSCDIVWNDRTMAGHGGDAYGLISDFYFDPSSKSGFIFITNGIFNKLTTGANSSFYDFEEAIFSAIRESIADENKIDR